LEISRALVRLVTIGAEDAGLPEAQQTHQPVGSCGMTDATGLVCRANSSKSSALAPATRC